jgi:hypothetical protein
MSHFSKYFYRIYGYLIKLYPRAFRNEFSEEMQAVFGEAIATEQWHKSTILFLRELIDLPGSILNTYAAQWFGGNMSSQNEYIVPSTRRQAFFGTLPFLTYGIIIMIDTMDLFSNHQETDVDLAFYGLALTGFLIGWIRGFPLWSYSYLGWSLVIAFWWDRGISRTNWGYWIWLPVGIMALLALLWTHSLDPLKILARDIWNDWTRLTLAMFSMGGLIFCGGGEDHHPQWLLFSIAATLIICIGAWCFLRSSTLIGRVLSIAISFILSAVPMGISYLTWDWRAYYGLPPAESWRGKLGVAPIGVLFWLLILFWPALIALIHYFTNRRTANA